MSFIKLLLLLLLLLLLPPSYYYYYYYYFFFIGSLLLLLYWGGPYVGNVVSDIAIPCIRPFISYLVSRASYLYLYVDRASGVWIQILVRVDPSFVTVHCL